MSSTMKLCYHCTTPFYIPKAYDTHLNDRGVLQSKAIRTINGVPPWTNIDKFDSESSLIVYS